MWKWAALLLLIPGLLWALPSRRVIPERQLNPGSITEQITDTTAIVANAIDTTRSFSLGALNLLAYYGRYQSRNDSSDFIVALDISPDQNDDHFLFYDNLDTIDISGTNDTIVYKQITTPPNWALYGRLRIIGGMPAGDTVDVTTFITKTYLYAQ